MTKISKKFNFRIIIHLYKDMWYDFIIKENVCGGTNGNFKS